jgi:hypothetical protein
VQQPAFREFDLKVAGSEFVDKIGAVPALKQAMRGDHSQAARPIDIP